MLTPSSRPSFHAPCKSFLRLRLSRELSLGENFSSAKDSLPRALISGRGSSRTCAYLLRDSRATGTDILEGSTPPCAEMLPDFSWPERTPSAGRGLPSVLAVNPGSTGPTPLLSCSTWWSAPRSRHAYASRPDRQLCRNTRLLRQDTTCRVYQGARE
jgi:hypothetical protein